MSFGDVGGAVTELIVTCKTPSDGDVCISKGDAVTLVGPYTVSNIPTEIRPVFGQSMADSMSNDQALPIKVRGIAIFHYNGMAPNLGQRIFFGDNSGFVRHSNIQNDQDFTGAGMVLKVDENKRVVHVLL